MIVFTQILFSKAAADRLKFIQTSLKVYLLIGNVYSVAKIADMFRNLIDV